MSHPPAYNLSYVSGGPPGGPAPPAGAVPPTGAVPPYGAPPAYSAMPYPPAPYPPGPAPPMVQPGHAPPMVPPGHAPPMVPPGHAPPMVSPAYPPAQAPPMMAAPATNMGPVYNAPVPFITTVPRPLQDGQTIHITGSLPQAPTRFHINLSLGNGLDESVGIAMHINPRFDEKEPVVVRNSYLKNRWGEEERWGGYFPLVAGGRFECIILVQTDCYKIAFNGHHFCEYKHRHPKDQVTHLVIKGDVVLECVLAQKPTTGALMGGPMAFQPAAHPGAAGAVAASDSFKVPYKQEIPGALYAGRTIYVSGVPNTPSYYRFAINFGYDKDFKKDIAFHFNPRYKENAVVRNTMAGYYWGKEERNQPEFPFHPGKPFDIIILVEQDQYKVDVNGQHFITYQHRLRNLGHIKFMEITGDISLTSVRL